MERLASPEAKGIRAFFSPKSAEDVENEQKEREKVRPVETWDRPVTICCRPEQKGSTKGHE